MADSALVADLRAVVRQERFRPKALLVSDFEAGHSLVRHLALTGTPVVNLRVCTPASLAAEVAGLTSASPVVSLLLVEDLLAQTGAGPRLAESYLRALTELRLAGLTASALGPDQFETRSRGQAMLELLRAYEEALAARRLADLAQLFRLAIENRVADDRLYLIPGSLHFRPGLEQAFVDALTAGRARVLAHDPPGALPAGTSVHLTHAAGIANEVRAALRRILGARSPFDGVELAVTEYEEYSRALHDTCASLGIPATFSRGLPALATLPGRGLAAFLTWVAEGFMVPAIATALADGVLVAPGAVPGQGVALAALLRKSPIGWGRERYLPALQALEADMERRQSLLGLEQAVVLKTWFGDLLRWVPEPAEGSTTVALADLCQAGRKLLEHCLPETAGLDRLAVERLTGFLADIEGAGTGRYPLSDAARRLADLLAPLRVGESGPRPGQLHVTDLEGAGWAGRRSLVILGLDQERFPGAGLQDPLLLDGERQRISTDLPLSYQRLAQKREQLSCLLAAHSGELVCSYSTFDPAAGRTGFPSAAMLEAERLRTGDRTLDYSQLLKNLGDPVSYAAPAGAGNLDAQDWWLAQLVRPEGLPARAPAAVRSAHPYLAQGLEAAAARAGDRLTAHDGCVGPDADLDPRQNPALVLSPSRLEELGRCPLRYFFRYVLEIAPPEELAYDPGRWLDAAQRGQLLHKLFELFLKGLKAEGVDRPAPADLDRLLALADAVVTQWRGYVPPPSEAVFDAERAEIRRSAAIFLRAETDEPSPGVPAFFELGFGTEPVLIPTAAGGAIRLRGRIDRIDRVGGSRYAIWDYKTGSTWAYEEQGYFQRGRQIQHALYAVAAEEVLRRLGLDPQAQVEGAGYFFPTEKGEGQRRLRMQNRRADLGRLLDELSGLAGAGLFVAAEDAYACKYCDYLAACGGKRTAEQTRAKLEASAELAPLRRIAAYE